MKVSDIIKKLNLKVIAGEEGLNNEVTGGYTSDLLSDVMGNADEGQVWITLQTHRNVMAVASLKEVAAVIIVKGLEAEESTISQSNDEGIPLLSSDLETFELSGQLYQILHE
ncbi:DRTGG domain-containing protein [Carboxylicivirga linearis]|uniref:Serine kinase n=1 Tax=Carboxylicivirga linearis TaxID=1628157 RepID=A0ABS5JZ22_9BACT|nr:DRTGG domain-containing protein [Carboxylicivirga linearis]MBS2100165.1 serine kinase [Carboxylicivirga linearis]